METVNREANVRTSVIVPIYNVEKYLSACLDSIINQTYRNFEIILVDDGATDGSGVICDQYAQSDGRIHVIHKKNEGANCARQTGVLAAQGDYIAFVDADDWLDEDFLEYGIHLMENEKADIVIMGCTKENENCSEIIQNKIRPGVYDFLGLTGEVWPRMLHYEGFYEFGILPFMWNKFYRRNQLEACCSDMDLRIYDGEDAAVVYPYLLKSKKAVITQDAKYHYRIHSGSITASRKADYYENTARLYLYLASKFQETEYGRYLMPQLDNYMRMMIWQGKPGGFIESTKFIFPFREVPKGASIILYGAGYVGQIFHYQIIQSDYCTIAAWVDKGYQRKELRQMGVVGMEALQTQQYDNVVLAVSRVDVAEEIMNELVSYGVRKEKILSI